MYISDGEDDLLNLTMADLAETFSEDEDEDLDLIEMAAKDSKFKVGDWVLVSFSTKTSVKHYIAQVIDLSEDEPIVKCARKKFDGDNTFVWPDKEDICTVNTEDILIRLPVPNLGRRDEIKFKMSFATYNIQ